MVCKSGTCHTNGETADTTVQGCNHNICWRGHAPPIFKYAQNVPPNKCISQKRKKPMSDLKKMLILSQVTTHRHPK